MSSHFRRYGKKLMKWAKVQAAKNAARVSAGEKTVSSLQDTRPETAPYGRSALIPSRKPVAGWQTHCTKTSALFGGPPAK